MPNRPTFATNPAAGSPTAAAPTSPPPSRAEPSRDAKALVAKVALPATARAKPADFCYQPGGRHGLNPDRDHHVGPLSPPVDMLGGVRRPPDDVMAILLHGVATRAAVRAAIGVEALGELVHAGVLVPRPGRLLLHPPDLDAWTQIIEVQLRYPDAVASHRLAAWIHRAAPFNTRQPEHLDFVSAKSSKVSVVRRMRGLRPVDVVSVGGVNVTTPARMLADLGRVVDDDVLEQVGEWVLRAKLTTHGTLRDLATITARRGHPGPAALRRFLRRRGPDTPATASELETRFVQTVRRLGFPAPLRQFQVPKANGHPYRVDFAWRTSGRPILVEVDGAGVHANPDALVDDLRRQNVLVRARNLLLRFSADDVDHRPDNIDKELGLHVRRRRKRITNDPSRSPTQSASQRGPSQRGPSQRGPSQGGPSQRAPASSPTPTPRAKT